MKSRGFFRTIAIVLGSLSQLWVGPVALAAIPKSATSYELDLSQVQKIESVREIRQADVARVIPTNLESSNDAGQVATRILDHALNNYFNDPNNHSPLVRSAKRIEKAAQTDVNLGQSEDTGIKHNLNFQLNAAQTKAMMRYSGLVDANLSYRAIGQEWKLEVSQKLNEKADLVIDRTAKTDEQIDKVSVRWTF